MEDSYQDDDYDLTADLIIWDFECDPSEITRNIGIDPTTTWIKGDVIRKDPNGINPPMVQKNTGWMLSSQLPKTTNAEAHADWIINQLRLHEDKVKAITKKYDSLLQISGDQTDYHVGLSMSRTLLDHLREFNLRLDFSIHSLPKMVLR